MIKLIDTFSYTNRLRSVSPMWKSGFAAVLMVLSYLSHPVTQMMIVGWLFVWITLYARIPVKAYSLLIGASCLFYAASLPAIVIEFTSAGPVSPDGMILFTFARWTSYVTEAGIYEAGSLLARIIACLSCLAFVMLTTPMSELFQVMKKMACAFSGAGIDDDHVPLSLRTFGYGTTDVYGSESPRRPDRLLPQAERYGNPDRPVVRQVDASVPRAFAGLGNQRLCRQHSTGAGSSRCPALSLYMGKPYRSDFITANRAVASLGGNAVKSIMEAYDVRYSYPGTQAEALQA